MEDLRNKFKENFPEIVLGQQLAPYSTFKIGGPADFFYHCKDFSRLPDLIKFAQKNDIPYIILGAGSNVLFDDEGFRGLVIRLEADQITIKGSEIIAQAGALVPVLLRKSFENGLTGLEKWFGLPGTVGGAVRGNAGCNGLETKNILKSATIFDPQTGKIKEVKPSYFKFYYRFSRLKETEEIVLQATFKLKKAKKDAKDQEKQARIKAETEKNRLDKQPKGFTTGSFFKNPSPEMPAGYLIDQVGLKGHRHGQAQISEKHANFFLNLGGATSKDIIALAVLARAQVQAKFDLILEPEVQIFSPYGKASLP